MATTSKTFMTLALSISLVGATSNALAPISIARAQQASGSTNPSQKSLGKEKLEQLVAPIALYPDSLLSQVLMASTYPLEIVQAARWVATNGSLKGKALEDALATKAWDPSVKSLVAIPAVLKMLNEKLDWTQQLGDAFLAQQKDVMAAVQSLRLRADKAGQLKSTKEQKVSKSSTGGTTYIVIEPQSPSVVYVPVYSPTVVYGAWPYAAYPPYYYYPPGYVAGSAFWFGTGVAVGAALWGGCNWGRNEVNININHYNQFNKTNISNTAWRHDATHRHGVPYSNSDVAREFRQNNRNHESREQFRGRADADRADLNRAGDRPANRDLGRVDRPSDFKRDTPRQFENRQPSAFDGLGSGRDVRADSARGQASRSSFDGRSGARGGPGGGGGARGPGGRGR